MMLGSIMSGTNRVHAQESTSEAISNQEVELQMLAYDVANDRSLAVFSTHSPNGTIWGNGVRLRKSKSHNV